MSKRTSRTPYLEIALTMAVLGFLALVVAGGFNQPADNIAQMTADPR